MALEQTGLPARPHSDFPERKDLTSMLRKCCAEIQMVRRKLQLLIGLVFMAFPPSMAASDLLIDGVPLPPDAKVVSPENSQPAFQQWEGVWVGAWGGTLKHILLVESIAENGQARVVYAVGENPSWGIRPVWRRFEATVSENSLKIVVPGFSAIYQLASSGAATGTFTRGSTSSRAAMRKGDLAALAEPGFAVDWTRGKSEIVQTDLAENGKPIRHEVVIFTPPGKGPFPLAVINHGSTGTGDNPALFAQTWISPDIADFLNERGWIVAFPQRRGRGKSDGQYDEGFAPNRAEGYTCDPKLSLAGAYRALQDIEAAISAIRHRPDVASSPILIGGQSRGGVLAAAYAGDHPEQILGVLNFVGGWMGEGCSSAKVINETLFERGGRFGQPALWLYGRGDPFYSIEHSRHNFAAFQAAGGRGTFLEFEVPTGNGHQLHSNPQLWIPPADAYLNALAAGVKR